MRSPGLLTVLCVVLVGAVSRVAGVRLTAEELDTDSRANFTSRKMEYVGVGKSFLSVMTWNVEKLDGTSKAKTTYVNDVITRVVGLHKVDVVFLQEAQSCGLLGAAKTATGMACVESVVCPDHEALIDFTVLGGVILYSTALLDPAAGTENRCRMSGEWKSWLSSNDSTVVDVNGRSLKAAHSATCTWSSYKNGRGCENIYSDIPKTNSIKLYLKSGKWEDAMAGAFPAGIRPMNIHLFSGVSQVRKGELSDASCMDRRTFQMRALLWINNVWNVNDNLGYGEQAPVTVYAGDFNTLGKKDIARVMRPASDYGLRPWLASDAVRTHGGGGYLDHVVMSTRPSNVILRSSTEVFDQVDKGDPLHSDHDPLIVKLYATRPRVDAGNAGGKPPKPTVNAWDKPLKPTVNAWDKPLKPTVNAWDKPLKPKPGSPP